MELSPVLKHFVDTAFRVAEDQFKEDKDVLPQITLLAKDEEGVTIVPILFTDNILGAKDGHQRARVMTKYSWESVLKERPQLKLLALTVMVDVWMKSMPTMEVATQLLQGTLKRPSQMVGSQEMIVVQLTVGQENLLYQWPYVKSGKEVVFSGEPQENKGYSSLIIGLWPI